VVRFPSDTIIDEELSSSNSKVFKSSDSADPLPRQHSTTTSASQVLSHGTGVGFLSRRDNYDIFMISPPPSPPGEEEDDEEEDHGEDDRDESQSQDEDQDSMPI